MNFQFSRDDHFRTGYGKLGAARRSTFDERFEIRIGRVSREGGTLEQECLNSARAISAANGGRPVAIPLSGGLDSACALRVFTEAEVPVRVYTMRFAGELNAPEVNDALNLCRQLGHEPRILDIDIRKFFESGDYFKYAELGNCGSPQITTHLWLVDQIDETPVLPGQVPAIHSKGPAFRAKLEHWERDRETSIYSEFTTDPRLTGYRHVSADGFFAALPSTITTWATDAQDSSYFRYFLNRARPGVPQFFHYSPEQIWSAVCVWQSLDQLAAQEGVFTQKVKWSVYRAIFPDLPFTAKRTGFEILKEHYRNAGTGFDELFRKPLRRLYPLSHVHTLISLADLATRLGGT